MLRPVNHVDNEALLQAFDAAQDVLRAEHEAMKSEMEALRKAGKTKSENYTAFAELDDAWNYTETLLDHLKQALGKAQNRTEQENVIRIALENGFNSTVISDRSILGYEAFVEFHSLLETELQQRFHPEESPWTDFLLDMVDYGDLQFDAYYDICDLVAARRIAKGEDSSKVYIKSPYALACEIYCKEHPEFDSDEFTNEQFHEVGETAQNLVEDALTPFEAALPDNSPMSIAWFIARATDSHESYFKTLAQRIVAGGQKHYGFTREIPAITPANDDGKELPSQRLTRLKLFPKRADIPDAPANDNGLGDGVEIYNNERIQGRVIDTLTPIFLNQIDAATNVHDLLAAKRQLEGKLTRIEVESGIIQR